MILKGHMPGCRSRRRPKDQEEDGHKTLKIASIQLLQRQVTLLGISTVSGWL